MHFMIEIKDRVAILVKTPDITNDGYTLLPNPKDPNEHILSERGKPILSLKGNFIETGHHCKHQLYVNKRSPEHIHISSDLKTTIEKSHETPKINKEHFIKYLMYGTQPCFSSPFAGVLYLPPGTALDIVNWVVINRDWDTATRVNFLDILETHMEKSIPSTGTIGLEYSGGLESTILLHILLRLCPERLKLYHITDHFCASGDDTQSVIKTAERYKCDITILNYDDSLPFGCQPCTTLLPSFPHTGLVNTAYLDFSNDLITNQNTTLINGAGGDALFCALPQKGLVIELIKERRYITAAITLKNLSEYFRSPIASMYAASKSSYHQTLNRVNDPEKCLAIDYGANLILKPEHIDKESNNRSSYEVDNNDHRISLRDRTQNALINKYEMLTSPLSGVPGRYLYPFLSPESLATALQVHSHKLIKGKFDRHFLRQSAFDRYSDNSLWNTRKGSAMGLTQKSLLANRFEIEQLILNGPLVELDIVDTDRIQRLISGIAVGAIQCPHALIHLYTANMFIKHWEPYING